MDELIGCSECGGFLGSNAAVCPHCDARPAPRRRGRWGVLLGLAGSASLGLTMMACYGAPPQCEPGSEGCGDPPDAGGMTDGGADGPAS
jgi:hypothetical protein